MNKNLMKIYYLNYYIFNILDSFRLRIKNNLNNENNSLMI